jgi:cation diffusion facilitator CzcD-associated flavoprotein CzcO
VRAKYGEERAKRMVEGRAAILDLARYSPLSRYRHDPFTPHVERAPLSDDVDAAIVGAGIAGVVVGARLREAGLEKIRLIDQAGGIGGTWYWNRYPGVMCDIESYIYMPMLEELQYVPTMRYARGEEIRRHIEAIARTYGLVEDALFHTDVEESRWREDLARWSLRTDRGDEVRARYLVLAPGILNLMKLPAAPGIDDFAGPAFHTARWQYEHTGGGPDGHLDKLADKVVGVIGTGASGIQCVPHLAETAKHLYVFQRTPSAVGVRDNRPTAQDFSEHLSRGWQRERMDNFFSVMTGQAVDRDLTDDGWTHHMARVANPSSEPGISADDRTRIAEELDFAVMEAHRLRIDETVSDPGAAEILKPYYRYLCKRPCFHDEYLPVFNRANVTLVDCPAGVERITQNGVVVEGIEYLVDCLIYATGFEPEATPLPRKIGHLVVGRGGVTIAEKWKDGPRTLHGMTTSGFPNLFLMPAPRQQAATTNNYTHMCVEGAEHIGATVALLEHEGVRTFDVRVGAEDDWAEKVARTYVDNRDFMAACTPSRFNAEGHPALPNPRYANYGGGLGDLFSFRRLLAAWRENGNFEGWELVRR